MSKEKEIILTEEDKNIMRYCVNECLEAARINQNEGRVLILEKLSSKLEKLHKVKLF